MRKTLSVSFWGKEREPEDSDEDLGRRSRSLAETWWAELIRPLETSPLGALACFLVACWIWLKAQQLLTPTGFAPRYWDVVSSLYTLNVSHRYEANRLASFANFMGVPVSVIPQDDVMVLGSAFLAGCGHFKRRKRFQQPRIRETSAPALR